ncbi:hypothetical protein [Paraburkholderia hayleyella]|uniref:hypothetical protein n=1 Tax=Paraburkholderia hayleyella TaxID=2152889 RepID=UPI0012911F9A|nr:hypothetical protein [Paraburkholderia hayleyella]
MARSRDPRVTRAARKVSGKLTQGSFAPQPVHSRARRLMLWGAACIISGLIGMALTGMYLQHSGTVPFELCKAPAAGADLQAELARTQLALMQERASRAAVQKTANASAAEVSRLNTELLFLRGQKQAPR